MPDEMKSNATNETASEFIQREIQRARHNLQCAIQGLGRSSLTAANPIPWFRRYPVKCGIATGVLLVGGTLAAVAAMKSKSRVHQQFANVPPVNVYIKKPKAQSKGWGTVGTALMAALSAKLTESLKATISNSFSEGAVARGKTVIVPNPQLRDVQI